MAKFCGKCGSQLDDTGKCPNCDYKPHKKKRSLNKRSIISIIVVIAILLSSVASYFAITFQAKAVTNDYTEDMFPNNSLTEGSDEEQTAILSPNVAVFIEEEASKINEKISNVQITNVGLYIDVESGTSFDDLDSGDIFYLEGAQGSPLGETYIGKIVAATTEDAVTTYLIETPMVDEVFDVLKIDYEEEFTAEDINSIQTISGVTVKQVDDISKSFTQMSNESSAKPQITTLAYSSNITPQVSMLSSSVGDDIMLEIDVDLLEVFGLQEEGAIGFDEYEYTEGYRVNVCITETGRKYHKETCSCLHSSKEVISLSDAVNDGYEPCFICVPPILKDEQSNFKADASLTLEGKVGLEDLNYSIDYDWDIINGGGLEKLDAQAKGNFVTEVGVKSELSLELGGQPTTITIPIDNIKLQGLKEKLFPIAFISYNGVSLNVSSLFPGNDYIRSTTSVVPVTVGAIIYTDISGNLTVDATASFNFNYEFDCSYTAIKDGQWVNEWKSDGEPSFKTGLDFEIAGDLDAHIGCSVSLYVFNLNVAEIAVAKVGFEGEGNLKIQHSTEYRKTSDEWEKTTQSETSGSLYGRLYLKILEINIKLKTRIKVWGLVDYSGTIDYTYVWLDKTIAEWGTRNETRYNSSIMSYSAITAKDQQAIYYKDTNDLLIKEVDGYKTVLFDQNFFSICGIDSSYIYLVIPNDDKYEIRRVSKNGTSDKVIADDVSNQLAIDEKYLYYVSTFDSTSVIRLDRQSLKEEQFATFEDDVKFMRTQKDNFYVVTEEGGLFASFFGGTSKCYLLNSSGGILASYGESPEINQYFLSEFDSYYEASRMTSNGYLRDTASEVYWMSHNGTSTILAEGISGWNAKDIGIFTTVSADDGAYQIVLYRAADGVKINVTNASSNQAFFTLCQSNGGEWYYFDQTDSDLILYALSEDFGSKTELKNFSLDEIPYNLTDCAMTIMNNTIYFYTMPNDSTSKVLYRYDILSNGGGFR